MRSLLLFLALVVSSLMIFITPSVAIAAGPYPEGSINFDGKTERALSIKKGEKMAYTVKITKGTKVCEVLTPVLNSSGGFVQGLKTEFTVNRGQESFEVKSTLDTSTLAPGKYYLGMYARTGNCPGDVYGNQDDGFDCDGTPTCHKYCGQNGREATVQAPVACLDRLFYCSTRKDIPYPAEYGGNSCGQPADGNFKAGSPNYRQGECELVACDRSGKNLDNLTFTVTEGTTTPATSSKPSASASASVAPGASGSTTPSSAPTSTVTILDSSAAGTVTVPAEKSSLSTDVDLTKGIITPTNNQLTIGDQTRNLSSYNGGDLAAKPADLSTGVAVIGGTKFNIGKAVNLQSASNRATELTNTNVSAVIPNNTTVLSSSSWDGKIVAPKLEAASGGTAPSGFQVGSNVVVVGSRTQTLIFDKPVTLTIKNYGGAVGYKPAGGSKYEAITEVCGGSYAQPNPPKTFPGECFVTNEAKTETKILTYHLTEFVALVVIPPVSYITVNPSVCMDPKDENKVAAQIKWAANPGYQHFVIARTKCSSYDRCDGQPELVVNGKVAAFTPSARDFQVKPGEFWKYQIWGLHQGQPDPDTNPLSNLNPNYWSRPVVVKIQKCGNSNSLQIKELKVDITSPQPSNTPPPSCAPGTGNAFHPCQPATN